MGGFEGIFLEILEPLMRDHSEKIRILIMFLIIGHLTLSGGQFFWGENLLKSNGGVQRFPQTGRKSVLEYKGRRELNCKTDKSSRGESRS